MPYYTGKHTYDKTKYSKVHVSGRKVGEIGNAVNALNKEVAKIAKRIWRELLPNIEEAARRAEHRSKGETQ